jgi:hypothetical protein
MPPPPQGPSWNNTDIRLRQAFLAMAADAPGAIWMSSGWRSHDQQAALHRAKPGLAAEPGHSNHEFGLAIDMGFENAATRRWVHANAARYGLWFPMDYEPWHAQLIGVDRHNVQGGAQVGGGRDAFAPAPDGRYPNPYDIMAGNVAMEDNTDPMTQFERLMAAVSSPGDMPGWAGATPEPAGIASPAGPSGPGESMATPAPEATPVQTHPGDALSRQVNEEVAGGSR